jgi:Tol biopolymer transport system component
VVRLNGTVDETVTGLPASLRDNLTISPDGRWMAWSSRETGRTEIYVEPFGRAGSRVQVSVGGGDDPLWSRDGRALYFIAQHTVFEAKIHAGATFSSDPPIPVFTASAEIDNYDVTPDGQKFLVLRHPPADFQRFSVLVNWQAKIR